MEASPGWKEHTIVLDNAPDEPQTLFYRDPQECLEFLLANPTWEEEIDYVPVEIFLADGKSRVYTEMNYGNIWNEIQVRTLSFPCYPLNL